MQRNVRGKSRLPKSRISTNMRDIARARESEIEGARESVVSERKS